MKLLYIIGCGMGAGSITMEGTAALSEAQAVLGASEAVGRFALPVQERFSAYRKEEVDKYIAASEKTVFALLVPGDTGFFSSAADYSDNSIYRVRFIAGISSVSYFFSKCRLPWQEAKLLNAQRQSCKVVDAVRRSRLTFLLTGGNVSDVARRLCEAGFSDLLVHVGESLGAPDETVGIIPLSELCYRRCSPLTVLIVENPYYDPRQRTGIPADEFLQTGSMTVSSGTVRAAVMSFLCPAADSVCWDIGSACGAVAAEMALSAYEGDVYAVEASLEAAELAAENSKAFQTGNVSVSVGKLPSALATLPAPDCVYIDSVSTVFDKIVSAALKLNHCAKIITTADTPQNVVAAVEVLEGAGLEAGVTQISCARGQKLNGAHHLAADDPVYIIFGGGEDM